MPEPRHLPGSRDLRHRSRALHRVRGPFRQTPVPAGLSGGLHPPGPRARRDPGGAAREVSPSHFEVILKAAALGMTLLRDNSKSSCTKEYTPVPRCRAPRPAFARDAFKMTSLKPAE